MAQLIVRLNRACAVLCLLLSCAAPEPGPPPEDGGAGTVCDQASCSGCCQNGVCYSGYENATCGLLGQQCVACPEWHPCSKTRRCAPPPEASAPSQPGTGGAVADAKIGPIDPDGGDAGDAGVPPQQEKPTCYYVGWVTTCH